MANQTDQLRCFAVCITHNAPHHQARIGNFEAEPVSVVHADTLRILLDCDFLECVTWRTSNVDHGLIWMDEHGTYQDKPPTAVLKDSPKRSFGLLGQLCGSLVFTGPGDETGEAHWLSQDQASRLYEHLLDRKATLLNDHCFLELIGIIQEFNMDL